MDALAYVGGFVLAVQQIPQIYRVWTRRSASDLSFVFVSLNVIGLCLMLSYTLLTRDYPIAIPVGVSLCLSCVLGISKVYIDRITDLQL